MQCCVLFLGNSAPKFTGNTTSIVKTAVGQETSLNVEVKDTDGDTVKLYASIKDATGAQQLASARLNAIQSSTYTYTATLTWTPALKGHYTIELKAEDSYNAWTVVNPHLILCACSNAGQCNYEATQVGFSCHI